MPLIPTDLLRRALSFYENYPDGQYDNDVVVPLLAQEISRREGAPLMSSTQNLAANLQALADHFQYWLDWQTKDRAKENLITDGDTKLILYTPTDGVTPPVWPTRQALTNIIAVIREASEMAEQAHDDAMEAKFNDR